MSITEGTSIEVSNSIAGEYQSIANISAELGVSINKSIAYEAAYELPVPSGQKWQIIYRPHFYIYKVVERKYYKIDGYSTKTSEYKVSYVQVFANWDYSYKVLPTS